MSKTTFRLPDSLHKAARELAKRDHSSFNHFLTLALAEKVSALLTEEYLEERARRGDRQAFLGALSKVPNTEPDESDRI